MHRLSTLVAKEEMTVEVGSDVKDKWNENGVLLGLTENDVNKLTRRNVF